MSERSKGVAIHGSEKKGFFKQYKRKVDALNSRFFEYSSENQHKFPVDLCCGPGAFRNQLDSFTGTFEAFPFSRFHKNKISPETPSPFLILKQEGRNLRVELNDLDLQFRSFQAVDADGDEQKESSARLVAMKTRLSHIAQKLDLVQQKALQTQSLFDAAQRRLKKWLVDIVVEESQFKRQLEVRTVMSQAAEQFGPTALSSSHRPPLYLHALLKGDMTFLLPKENPKPGIKEPKPHGPLPFTPQGLSCDLKTSMLSTLTMLPPCSHLYSPNTLLYANPNVMEWGKIKSLVAMNKDLETIQFQQRYVESLERLRRGWVNYTTLTKRHRRLCDEISSPYSLFPILRPNHPIRLLNLLGRGGFAQVWQGIDMESLAIRAIKIIELHSSLSQKDREFILASTFREVTLQRTLKHCHVVEMQQCFEITPSIFVASLDLCDGGTLDDYVQHHGPVNEEQACVWMQQILQALRYIHTTGKVVHFDIKPTNILLHNNKIKISDFGLHQPVGSRGIASLDMTDDQNQIGTLWYMPPEHLYAISTQRTSVFDSRFDVWSAGVVFYEMLYQRRPFATTTRLNKSTFVDTAFSLFSDITREGVAFPTTTNEITNGCKKFIERVLQPLEHRPNATEALNDSYFTQFMIQ